MLYAIFNCVFTVSLVFCFMEQTYYYQKHSLLFVTQKAANKIIIKRGREKQLTGALFSSRHKCFPLCQVWAFLFQAAHHSEAALRIAHKRLLM